MDNIKTKKLILFLIFLFECAPAASQNLKYQLQPGENVGQVLYKLGLTPLWSQDGSFIKTVELNSNLKEKYPDFKIPIFTWLTLPLSTLPENKNYSVKNGIIQKVRTEIRTSKNDNIVKISNNENVNIIRHHANSGDIIIHLHTDSFTKEELTKIPFVINVNYYDTPNKGERNIASQSIAVKKESTLESKLPSYEISVGLESHSLKISADALTNSSTAKIFSDSAYSINTHWLQRWNQRYSTALGFKATQYKISDNSENNLIDNSSSTLIAIGFDNKYFISEKVQAFFSTYYLEKYFLNPTSGSILLTSSGIIDFALGAQYQFLQWDKQKFNLRAFAHYSLARTESFGNIKNGTGYGVELNYNYSFNSRHSLGALTQLEYNDQGTDLFIQNNTEAIFSLKYNINFGGD